MPSVLRRAARDGERDGFPSLVRPASLPRRSCCTARLYAAPAFSSEAAVELARFSPPLKEPVRVQVKPQRNAPCPCGSGKKNKRCCAMG